MKFKHIEVMKYCSIYVPHFQPFRSLKPPITVNPDGHTVQVYFPIRSQLGCAERVPHERANGLLPHWAGVPRVRVHILPGRGNMSPRAKGRRFCHIHGGGQARRDKHVKQEVSGYPERSVKFTSETNRHRARNYCIYTGLPFGLRKALILKINIHISRHEIHGLLQQRL